MPESRVPNELVVTYSATVTVDRREMQRRGRIGGFVTQSRYDSKELTQAGRAAFLSKFLQQVDPNGELPEHERQRRAEAARRAHFSRLARLSARARSDRAQGKKKKREGVTAPAVA